MTAPKPNRLHRRRFTASGVALAGLAALFTLAFADQSKAQTSCPPAGPEVVFYSVTSATEPERTFEMPMREAIVVGGDAVQGRVRIFMRFAEPLSSSCSAEVYLWRHPSNTRYGRPGDTDTDPRVFFQDLFPEQVAERLEVRGDGDDDAVLVIPTNPYIHASTRYNRHDVWFSIGYAGTRHPFEVQQRSSTFELRAASASTVGRATVQVTATSSIQLHPRVEMPIEFTIAPATAGGFIVNGGRHPSLTANLDPGISPSRVGVVFGAVSPATPTLVTLVARTMIDPIYAGGAQRQERSVTVTVEPELQPCKVEARVALRSGGLDVIVVNTGTVLCTDLTIVTASGGKSSRDTIANLAPGREARLRQTIDPTSVSLVPLNRSTTPRSYGRVSIYLETKSGPYMLIGGREFTREDAVLMNSR